MNRRRDRWLALAAVMFVVALAAMFTGHPSLAPAAALVFGMASVMAVASWDGPRAKRLRAERLPRHVADQQIHRGYRR